MKWKKISLPSIFLFTSANSVESDKNFFPILHKCKLFFIIRLLYDAFLLFLFYLSFVEMYFLVKLIFASSRKRFREMTEAEERVRSNPLQSPNRPLWKASEGGERWREKKLRGYSFRPTYYFCKEVRKREERVRKLCTRVRLSFEIYSSRTSWHRRRVSARRR